MIYVFLSVCCSVIVSVFLKLAKRYNIDVFQAITWNYSMAIFLTWIFFRPQLQQINQGPLVVYGCLGLLLPVLFGIIGTSVRLAGIVRTDVAQRVSLFIPIVAAFFLFNEQVTINKLIGIALGFAAIICSIPWQKDRYYRQRSTNSWLYLLIVFVGMGIIDILFKQVALFKQVPYSASLFVIYVLAFVVAVIGLVYKIVAKTSKFQWSHILFGWILGVANFGNILFYLKAHQALANNPSKVFASMNIGVITLGAIIGMAVFREKLSVLNKVGIVLAIIAIVVIYYFS
jgi:drug/metabolite transporter (DMT)-like permease